MASGTGTRTWCVAGKAFASERPFSKADLRRFGDQAPPSGPILEMTLLELVFSPARGWEALQPPASAEAPEESASAAPA